MGMSNVHIVIEKSLKGIHLLGDLLVVGRTVLIWILGKCWDVVWNPLPEDNGQIWSLVNESLWSVKVGKFLNFHSPCKAVNVCRSYLK